eukprot:Sspe_Gene.106125::Locus_83332_Transcript_1_1_Confidence_1.000_Length_1379::g.106125::m.106125
MAVGEQPCHPVSAITVHGSPVLSLDHLHSLMDLIATSAERLCHDRAEQGSKQAQAHLVAHQCEVFGRTPRPKTAIPFPVSVVLKLRQWARRAQAAHRNLMEWRRRRMRRIFAIWSGATKGARLGRRFQLRAAFECLRVAAVEALLRRCQFTSIVLKLEGQLVSRMYTACFSAWRDFSSQARRHRTQVLEDARESLGGYHETFRKWKCVFWWKEYIAARREKQGRKALADQHFGVLQRQRAAKVATVLLRRVQRLWMDYAASAKYATLLVRRFMRLWIRRYHYCSSIAGAERSLQESRKHAAKAKALSRWRKCWVGTLSTRITRLQVLLSRRPSMLRMALLWTEQGVTSRALCRLCSIWLRWKEFIRRRVVFCSAVTR